MFRKLISNLPFSPALVHDVGFYARRLRNEEVTRKLTVLFVVLALIMQSLAVFSAPESANASSEQDIIRGGVSSLDDLLLRFDRNDQDFRDIISAIGISRDELVAMNSSSVKTTSDTYMLTRYGQLTAASDEASLSYQRSSGGMGVRYFTLLKNATGSPVHFEGWVGKSATVGWFGIVKNNGGVLTRGLPSSVNTIGNANTVVTRTVSAANLTQESSNAANNIATAQDKIAFTLKATNQGKTSATTPLSVHITDILEYSALIDAGGASLDQTTKTLSWPQVQLSPGSSQERTFVVQMLSQIPATPKGQSNPASYDCQLTLSYGTSTTIPVDCPMAKGAESIIGQLPPTTILTNIIFSIIVLGVVVYFYARTRQLKNEVKIIRHNLNTGTGII